MVAFVKISMFLLLINNGVLGSIKKRSVKELKFESNFKEKLTFVRGIEDSPSKICGKHIDAATKTNEILMCETNDKATITWQVCHSFKNDVMSRENHLECNELITNEAKYCNNVSNKSKTTHHWLTSDILLKSVKMIDKGCTRCISQSNDQEIKSTTTEFNYIDKCGTPSRYDAINPHKDCHIKNKFLCQNTMEFEKNCAVSVPQDVVLKQNLTVDGKPDLVLEWKEPAFTKDVVYGYKIEFYDDTGFYHCHRLITKYDDTRWIVHGTKTYRFSTRETGLLDVFKEQHEYVFKLSALPNSTIVERKATISYPELCDSYEKQYGHRPIKCHKIRNIRMSCNHRNSATVLWNATDLPSNVTSITLYLNYWDEIIYLSPNTTSHTFRNVPKDSCVHVQLSIRSRPKDIVTYCSRRIDIPCEYVLDPVIILPQISKRKDKEPDDARVLPVIIISICVSIILIVIIVIYAYRRYCKPPDQSRPPAETASSAANKDTTPLLNITVMLVYPEGCAEVEKYINYVGQLLRAIGINVLVDIFQTERIAEIGIAKVLVDDFQAANYVILLCLDTDGGDKDVTHQNFDLVKNKLMQPSLRAVGNDGKRFIAVTLSKSSAKIPPFLLDRSYALSTDLEPFLQHVSHDIQTFRSTRFRDAVRDAINIDIDKTKKDILELAKNIKEKKHQCCYSSDCCKGTKKDNVGSSQESLASKENDHCVLQVRLPDDYRDDMDNDVINTKESYCTFTAVQNKSPV